MRLTSVLMTLSVSVAPVLAHADAFDMLQLDLRRYDDISTGDANEQQSDDREKAFQALDEFFPETGTGTGREGEVEEAFVTVRVNGAPYPLTDVPRQAWFAPYVRDMANRGIVTGYRDPQGIPTGIFGPERGVSVEELAKMAVAAAGKDVTTCPSVAKNTAVADRWSAPYVSCAEESESPLYSDGSIDPLRPATRTEVVVTILHAFKVPLQPVSGTGTFKDVLPSAQFASAIETAAATGIVSGDRDSLGRLTGTFSPDRSVNRAEVSKILSLALQVYVKQ